MSDKYQIIRVKKHSSFGSIASASRHMFREEPTPNADASMTKQNVLQGALGTEEVLSAVKSLVDGCDAVSKTKPVLCIEYMITASPEAFKRFGGELGDKSDFFDKSLEWLKQKHGAENVVASALHLDEKTPHLSVFVVPVVNEKAKTIKRSVNQAGGGRKTIEIAKPAQKSLNAKHYLGGRELLSKMQDDFHDKVASKFKLERGVTGSSLKHQKMRDYYKNLIAADKALAQIKPRELTFTDKVLSVVGIKTKAFKALENIGLAARVKALDLKQRHLPELMSSAKSSIETAEKEKAKLALKSKDLNEKAKKLSEKEAEHSKEKARLLGRIQELEGHNKELANENNELKPKYKGLSTPSPNDRKS